MAGLVALPAFNTLSRARLGTLLGVMTLLLTVLASIRVIALLGAVAGTVAGLFAVHALDRGLVGLVLDSLLRTTLRNC
jgi:hypothetical protein